MDKKQTKRLELQSCAAAGNWQKAIAIASKIRDLGDVKNAILDAHTAYTNPRFLVQVGKDIELCKATGKLALQVEFDCHFEGFN